jgi:signal transduction histidine kinase
MRIVSIKFLFYLQIILKKACFLFNHQPFIHIFSFIYFSILLSTCLLAINKYIPEQSDRFLELWRWQYFPELSSKGVRCIAEAKDKTIWFGVDGGIIRYDGMKWHFYHSKEIQLRGDITEICVLDDSSIYVGNTSGISRFYANRWERKYPLSEEVNFNKIFLSKSSNGGVWIGMEIGMLHIQNDIYTFYVPSIYTGAIEYYYPDARIILIPEKFCTRESWEECMGILVINRYIYARMPGSPAEKAGLEIGDKIISVNGKQNFDQNFIIKKLCGTTISLEIQRGINNIFTTTIRREKLDGFLYRFPVNGLYDDLTGIVWIGLDSGDIIQLIREEKQGGERADWKHLYKGKSISTFKQFFLKTSDGITWIGSEDHRSGLLKYGGKYIEEIRLSQLGGSDNNLSIIQADDNTIIFGGYGKLHVLKENKWKIYSYEDIPIPAVRLYLLKASDGCIWITGVRNDVYRFEYSDDRWASYLGLNFQCMTPDSKYWFISYQGEVVSFDGGKWLSYTENDGLIDNPVSLFVTKSGVLWAIGSHQGAAATAIFLDQMWYKQIHMFLSWGIDYRAFYEDVQGCLWFGANIDYSPGKNQLGGVLKYDPNIGSYDNKDAWTHYTNSIHNAPNMVYGIAQTKDGRIWFIGYDLRIFDGKSWENMSESVNCELLNYSIGCDAIHNTPDGKLLMAFRGYGILYIDGESWKLYNYNNGLAGNTITSILTDEKNNVWCATNKGISRFDGKNWISHALPHHLKIDLYGGSIKLSKGNVFWINNSFRNWYRRALPGFSIFDEQYNIFKTIKFIPDADPPETMINENIDRVSQPGNTIISWYGVDPWRWTPDNQLLYSYRIDSGEWSSFLPFREKIFHKLKSGKHSFEVRAMDASYNIDPTPDFINFVVIPTIWQQLQYQALAIVVLVLIIYLTIRLIQRNRILQISNQALVMANEEIKKNSTELDELNKKLNVELKNRKIAEKEINKLNLELELRVKHRTGQLESANKELEAFAYSVSHDLRTPLRHIDGFSQAIIEDYSSRLDDVAKDFLNRIRKASQRMSKLIDDLLNLSRITRSSLNKTKINLSKITGQILSDFYKSDAERKVEIIIQPDIIAVGDERLLHIALYNLLANAWKFTSKNKSAKIEFGQMNSKKDIKDNYTLCPVFYIRDNGSGFNMKYADKLFIAFNRLHKTKDFAGTGIGLATVYRIIIKHGGKIWAEGKPNAGATFYFTLNV